MANTAFTGLITTVGTSQAIRLERALFRSFPEFHQKAKVRAAVSSHGRLLISVVDEVPAQEGDDPVAEVFLELLAEDMQSRPERITPLSQAAISRARKLTKDVVVNDNEVLPDEIMKSSQLPCTALLSSSDSVLLSMIMSPSATEL